MYKLLNYALFTFVTKRVLEYIFYLAWFYVLRGSYCI